MFAKVFVGLLAVSGLTVAGVNFTPKAAKSCCYPGSPCCFEGSPCCVDEDCCYDGSPCCYPGSPCCEGSCASR